eukprot:GHVP01047480.1.p1 GENE.GHVP01047480.1~~GHVP01047480.1.p1  ORF type:complete len:219 (-),score=20.82 GHVP01047480.1:477-1133(-)
MGNVTPNPPRFTNDTRHHIWLGMHPEEKKAKEVFINSTKINLNAKATANTHAIAERNYQITHELKSKYDDKITVFEPKSPLETYPGFISVGPQTSVNLTDFLIKVEQVHYFTIAVEYEAEEKKFYYPVMFSTKFIGKRFRRIVGQSPDMERPICLEIAFGRTWRIHHNSALNRNYFNSNCDYCKGTLCLLGCRELGQVGGYDTKGNHYQASWAVLKKE